MLDIIFFGKEAIFLEVDSNRDKPPVNLEFATNWELGS